MPIIEPVIRPPAEAGSFLLQLTTGCSSNTCTFCGAYKEKPFQIKAEQEIGRDIEIGGELNPCIRRVFLMDGDALIIGNQRLVPVLKKINRTFPKLTWIASYANGFNIINRSSQELAELEQNRLKLIYIGLESGSQQILNDCKKRSSVSEMIEAVQKAAEAGIKSSVMVLLGLGARKNSALHVKETVEALNHMQPRYLSFLSVMLIPGTELYHKAFKGDFEELSPLELLQETYDIIAGLHLKATIFRSDHASNFLALEGRLPADQERILITIKSAIDGKTRLRPEYSRGL
jgi:Fe-S oxidoreductase